MTEVFILIGDDDHSGGDPLAAFTSYESAATAANRCDAHKSKEPEAPKEDVYDPANDDLFAAWRDAEALWRSRIPYRRDYDSYRVVKVELTP